MTHLLDPPRPYRHATSPNEHRARVNASALSAEVKILLVHLSGLPAAGGRGLVARQRADLAADLAVTPRSIQRRLQTAIAAGFLRVVRAGRKHVTQVYRLTVPTRAQRDTHAQRDTRPRETGRLPDGLRETAQGDRGGLPEGVSLRSRTGGDVKRGSRARAHTVPAQLDMAGTSPSETPAAGGAETADRPALAPRQRGHLRLAAAHGQLIDYSRMPARSATTVRHHDGTAADPTGTTLNAPTPADHPGFVRYAGGPGGARLRPPPQRHATGQHAPATSADHPPRSAS